MIDHDVRSPIGIVVQRRHGPLNDELDRAGDPDRITDLARVRNQFEARWVAGTIVRALFSTAAVVALTQALFLHGRATARRTIR